MATRRIGANWFSAAVTFDDFLTEDVNAYYSIDGGEDVLIDAISMEQYEESHGGVTASLYRGSFNGAIPEGALGSNVVVKIYDPSYPGEYLEYDPIDVCTDVATSVIISPSATTVQPGRTRQFTATFYAADDLSTDNHDTAVWSVDDGGIIDEDTGLFTAGGEVGGPFTVTVTAVALNDTATVNIALSVMSSGLAAAAMCPPSPIL